MLLSLAQWLQTLSPELGYFRVFQYITFRAVMAARTALLMGLIAGPWVIRKLAELKDLQGLLWAEGYASGDLKGPLFRDVAPALRRWHQQGAVLAVYSSGSVAAQQLLYGHSTDGDLRNLFSHWFDTRTGPKQDVGSYRAISEAMGVGSAKVLFISDSLMECEAAHAAKMQVLFSDREGNPGRDNGSFERISTYEDLQLNP